MSILEGKENLAVGRFVNASLHEMFLKKSIPDLLLQMFQTSQYSKQMFGFRFPLLLEYDKNDKEFNNKIYLSGGDRYWKNDIFKINNVEYLACNDWYNGDGKKRNNRSKYVKWFLEVEEKLKNI